MLQNFRILLLSLSLGVGLFAQVDRATLTGTVTDGSAAAIGEATVLAESSTSGLRRQASTSASGTYQIPGLPVGSYRLTISKPGFSSVQFETVVLTVGLTRTVDVQLQVGTVATALEV
ncbi:MAG: carboxypeptidase regulatory-like domain-containing protein, partial [Bryobacteraceae bacterium]|nr:carboxypeptidase regulatory-like domain-containing protein [Bryobacteraceae bacterium]